MKEKHLNGTRSAKRTAYASREDSKGLTHKDSIPYGDLSGSDTEDNGSYDVDDSERSAKRHRAQAMPEADHSNGPSEYVDRRYFNGAIRHSQIHGHNSAMAISQDDLLMGNQITEALVIAFYIEVDFLTALIPRTTKLHILTDDRMAQEAAFDHLPTAWTLQRLVVKAFSCMHTKVFLLKYDSFLRVIVTTANVLRMDYENLDNIFYIHDFPMQADPIDSDFSVAIFKMLNHHEISEDVYAPFKGYDMSSCRISLIVSIPGTYYGELQDHQFGLLSLAQMTKASPVTKGTAFVVEHCTSSLGQVRLAWLQSFRNCIAGAPCLERSLVSAETTKIVYPSFTDVEAATRIHGKAVAENIVFNGKWSAPDFPRDLMHHYESRRCGTLFHAKSTLVREQSSSPSTTGGTAALALLFGSHNASQAAWGDVHEQGPRARYPGVRTKIANYEVSVLIPGSLLASLLPSGVDWREAVTYRQESLRPYGQKDAPHTIRINR